jgi:hypothetical protein
VIPDERLLLADPFSEPVEVVNGWDRLQGADSRQAVSRLSALDELRKKGYTD